MRFLSNSFFNMHRVISRNYELILKKLFIIPCLRMLHANIESVSNSLDMHLKHSLRHGFCNSYNQNSITQNFMVYSNRNFTASTEKDIYIFRVAVILVILRSTEHNATKVACP
jgi:hypothetical protein